MFDWLYKAAKYLKKDAYILGGAGVALSTVIGKISSTTSWISNLCAIWFGGVTYSSFKNMEVAQSIVAKQKQIVDTGERLSLQHYPRRHQELKSLAGVLNALSLNGDTVAKNVQHTKQDSEKRIPSSKWYATLNMGVQTVLGFIIIAINSMANSEVDTTTNSESSKDSSLTAKDILNLCAVSVCILAQYGMHTFYAARKLRHMAEETDRLHTTISDAQKNTLFRAIEYNAFQQSQVAIDREIGVCNAAIEKIKPQITKLSATIDEDKERLSKLEKELADHQQDLEKLVAESQNFERELTKISSSLVSLNLSPNIQEKTEQIQKLEERKQSLLQSKMVADGEIERHISFIDKISPQTIQLRTTIYENKKLLNELQKELLDHKSKLAELNEERRQLILHTPEKIDELTHDTGQINRLMCSPPTSAEKLPVGAAAPKPSGKTSEKFFATPSGVDPEIEIISSTGAPVYPQP